MSSETGDMWRQLKEESRIHRHQKQNKAFTEVEAICKEQDIEIVKIFDYHFRLIKDNTVLDIFPQKNKYHNVTLNKRGEYKKLTRFITSVFSEKGDTI